MDWLRLWILNELTVRPAKLSRLVFRPDAQWAANWTFPGGPVFQAEPAARMSALLACAVDHEIVIYERAAEAFAGYKILRSKDYSRVESGSEDQLSLLCAAETKSGHNRWEADFAPDWSRFWSNECETFDEDGRVTSVEVLCAGEAILNDLYLHFPAYRTLDAAFGLQPAERNAVFGAQVTFWKILPIAVRMKWHVKSGTPTSTGLLGELQASGITLANAAMAERLREARVAQAILQQFSRRWTCGPSSTSDPRNGEPLLSEKARPTDESL